MTARTWRGSTTLERALLPVARRLVVVQGEDKHTDGDGARAATASPLYQGITGLQQF
jgi:hypothetical protein